MTDKMIFKDFYYIIAENNIFINAGLFRKMDDYTDLITHIITVNNDCLKLRKKFNQSYYFKIIVDLNNVKIKNADYEFLKMLIPFLENSYPDNLEKMYFHNTPFIFKTAYGIIRHFIHKETRQKIIFVKKNKKNNLDTNPNIYAELSEDKFDELF